MTERLIAGGEGGGCGGGMGCWRELNERRGVEDSFRGIICWLLVEGEVTWNSEWKVGEKENNGRVQVGIGEGGGRFSM